MSILAYLFNAKALISSYTLSEIIPSNLCFFSLTYCPCSPILTSRSDLGEQIEGTEGKGGYTFLLTEPTPKAARRLECEGKPFIGPGV